MKFRWCVLFAILILPPWYAAWGMEASRPSSAAAGAAGGMPLPSCLATIVAQVGPQQAEYSALPVLPPGESYGLPHEHRTFLNNPTNAPVCWLCAANAVKSRGPADTLLFPQVVSWLHEQERGDEACRFLRDQALRERLLIHFGFSEVPMKEFASFLAKITKKDELEMFIRSYWTNSTEKSMDAFGSEMYLGRIPKAGGGTEFNPEVNQKWAPLVKSFALALSRILQTHGPVMMDLAGEHAIAIVNFTKSNQPQFLVYDSSSARPVFIGMNRNRFIQSIMLNFIAHHVVEEKLEDAGWHISLKPEPFRHTFIYYDKEFHPGS